MFGVAVHSRWALLNSTGVDAQAPGLLFGIYLNSNDQRIAVPNPIAEAGRQMIRRRQRANAMCGWSANCSWARPFKRTCCCSSRTANGTWQRPETPSTRACLTASMGEVDLGGCRVLKRMLCTCC